MMAMLVRAAPGESARAGRDHRRWAARCRRRPSTAPAAGRGLHPMPWYGGPSATRAAPVRTCQAPITQAAAQFPQPHTASVVPARAWQWRAAHTHSGTDDQPREKMVTLAVVGGINITKQKMPLPSSYRNTSDTRRLSEFQNSSLPILPVF